MTVDKGKRPRDPSQFAKWIMEQSTAEAVPSETSIAIPTDLSVCIPLWAAKAAW
jgi:hypothetical protein